MRLLAIRLLALFAVLMMPFGMASAPAAPLHHEAMSAMPVQHCPEPGSKPGSIGIMAACAMACAAALPAVDLPPPDSPPAFRAPVEPLFIPTLSGIELEIATPPPRRS